ncbi:MAG: hypothetical protein FWE21_05635 [Defluviitaleaceae bacterium]|nr:hypothetical protein [Defluviitaleaceae bacterium]
MAERAVNFLEFSTLNDFLLARIAAGSAGDISSFVGYWAGSFLDSDLESVVQGTDFASLEFLYLPISIPDDFQIERITLTRYSLVIRYLPKGVEVTDETFWEAMVLYPSFEFGISRRQDIENEMLAVIEKSDATVDGLIDGIYLLVSPYLIHWESSGMIFGLNITPGVVGELMSLNEIAPYESVRFAETKVVNLLDMSEVMSLLERDTE